MASCKWESVTNYTPMEFHCADCLLGDVKEGDGDWKGEIVEEMKGLMEREKQRVETGKEVYKGEENMWSKEPEAEEDAKAPNYKNWEVKPKRKEPLSKMT